MSLGRGVAALAVLAALVAGCTAEDPAPGPAPSGAARAVVGEGCPTLGQQSTAAAALPDLELPCLGGAGGTGAAGPAPLPLRRLTGTPTVLNLWASWCAPCREELPALARLHRAAAGKVRVLGVASQDRPGAALAYAADQQLPFGSLDDSAGRLARALRRPGLPVTVLVAADGAVADVYQGPPLTDRTLRTLVRTQLGVEVG